MNEDELRRIKEVYRGRIQAGVVSRYSLLRPGELFIAQDRERAQLRLLRKAGIADLSELRVLEIGCGRGHRLLDWVRWGAHAENLSGIDLMPELLSEAKSNLPTAGFAVASGDRLPFRDASFDAVTQLTVFSSILDPGVRQAVAHEMWRVLRPGGFLLWYDLRYPNPRNKDVRPVRKREIYNLFSEARIHVHSTTLAPPLARRLAPVSVLACEVASLLPMLRSHFAALLEKSR